MPLSSETEERCRSIENGGSFALVGWWGGRQPTRTRVTIVGSSRPLLHIAKGEVWPPSRTAGEEMQRKAANVTGQTRRRSSYVIETSPLGPFDQMFRRYRPMSRRRPPGKPVGAVTSFVVQLRNRGVGIAAYLRQELWPRGRLPARGMWT